MKFCVLLWLTTVAFAQFNPTSSNGSGCVANGTPSYCNKAFSALSTAPANTNAQTQVVVPAPAPYSTLDLHSYLYSGASTRVLMHWQPWFCNTGTTCNSHINVGYNENSASTVTAQLAAMKALGVDVVVPDYYGDDPSKSFNLASVDAMAGVIAGNPTAYPKMLLNLDQGAWNIAGKCPAGSGITTVQMEACIEPRIDFMAVHYFYQSWYETSGGKPIITLFLDETKWPSVNFDTVWQHVHAHVAAGQSCGTGCTYTAQVLLLGRNSGSITRVGLDGGFAWSPALVYDNANPATQFQYDGTAGYLENFYAICRANPTKKCIGLIESRFDDSNASFGTGKLTAGQCGQLPILTAGKISGAGYSSSSQLEYAQDQTWNDMEEGTGVENGIDNCSSLSASIVGTTLNFTLTPTDATYFSLATIHHFQVLYCSAPTSCLVVPGLGSITPVLSGSASLAAVPAGDWTIEVQAVGQPAIRNRLSNSISFSTVKPSPVPSLYVKVSQKKGKPRIVARGFFGVGYFRQLALLRERR